jgi:hypothetical protein
LGAIAAGLSINDICSIRALAFPGVYTRGSGYSFSEALLP